MSQRFAMLEQAEHEIREAWDEHAPCEALSFGQLDRYYRRVYASGVTVYVAEFGHAVFVPESAREEFFSRNIDNFFGAYKHGWVMRLEGTGGRKIRVSFVLEE